MAGSFVENVNLLAGKVGAIEEANVIFDEGVIPILQEIATLDLEEAIADLKKGNYLGNRKVDINLALNMQGITETLINNSPELAEAIWTDATKTVLYDKAIATFVDGTIIELPFIFDGYPTTISTHGELLAQFTRLDYVYAQAQVDSIYQVTVGDTTDYVVTIDSVPFTYTSVVGATRESIIAGLANMINVAAVPITANVTDAGTKLSMTADVAGNPFFATVSPNMAINTIVDNIIEGPRETAFLSKLENTLAANFASPVVGEIVRLYDVIGLTSNVERVQLHAVSGDYVTATPVYYWAKTTSAFQTLSMRANDIIKLGSEIDNIIALANNIQEVIEVQNRLPELIDTYDVNGNPNGDTTIYNNLTELVAVYDKLIEIIAVYNDIKIGGTNYTNTVATNLTGSNTVGTVAADLVLGINSAVKKTGDNIASVVTVAHDINNVNSVAGNSANINSVATTIVPNMAEILLADTNAAIATTKALESSDSAESSLQSATDAAASAASALSSATTATTKAGEALVSANNAATSATNASMSETQSATSAGQSATSASSAANSAGDASASAIIASAQAGIAATKASEASVSANSAIVSKNDASSSATIALNSSSNAGISEVNAATSATSANASAATASAKASEASTSASTATTKASEAAASATSASSSATIASSGASTSTTKASEASTSAINALASENKAKKWADESEDVPVESGLYSAKHWAAKASEIVGGGLIDDVSPSTSTVFSSTRSNNTYEPKNNNIQEHISNNTTNPHNVTKSQVGLSNVDNTSDVNKPISNATTTALADKQDTLVSGTNIKTINSSTILGSGDLALLTATNPSITGSITEQVYNLTGTAINPANGTIQYKTVSSNTTFTETLTDGQSVLLRLISADSYTITFPTITWVGAIAPILTANCAIVLWKEQSTLYGAYVGTLV